MTASARIVTLDRLRGICVFCMLAGSLIKFFPCFGPLYSMLGDDENALRLFGKIYLSSFAAPFFSVLLGMSCTLSYARRAREGRAGAMRHLLQRYVVFTGLGSILVSGEYLFRGRKDPWILQTVLMFAVVAVSLLWGVTAILGKKTAKTPFWFGWIPKILFCLLAVLACIDIVLGFRDAWVCLFSKTPHIGLEIKHECFAHWSILHVIGVSGLLTVPFVALRQSLRLPLWFALVGLRLYLQWIPRFSARWDILVMGGMLGAFGFMLIMLGGMILMDFYVSAHHGKIRYLAFLGAVALTAALLLWAFPQFPVNERGVTVNFALAAIACFGTAFIVLSLFEGFVPRFSWLIWWGQNPLVIFCLGVPLKGLLMWLAPKDPPLWSGLLCLFLGFGWFLWISRYLHRHRLLIRL